MVVGRKTNPLPGTTSKGNILTNLMLITEVSVLFFLSILILIPLTHGHTVFKTV